MRELLHKITLPFTLFLDFITKYFKAIVFLFIVYLILSPTDSESLKQENLAKIYLYGPIFDAGQFLEDIERVNKESIQGVVLVVDSPGGIIAPSIEISEAVKRLAQKKQVVVYAAGTMASGSYYAGIWGDVIIANPGSLIGSIGVIFESVNVKELIEKIGIQPQSLKIGKYKEAGTPFREWEEHEKEELERILKKQYGMFVADVAAARGLDDKEHETYADGRIFTAYEAEKLGLIDRVGTIALAEAELLNLTGITDPVWLKEDEYEKFFRDFMDNTYSWVLARIITIY